MLLPRLVFTSLALGFVSSASANMQPVEITIQQYTQTKCRGVLTESQQGNSGDCIVYDVRVENFSNKPAKQVSVAALVPEHTRLVRPFKALQGIDSVETTIKGLGTHGVGSVTTELPVVAVGKQNAVILRYKVKIQ